MKQDSHAPEPSLMAAKQTELVKTAKGEFYVILHFYDQDRIGCMLNQIEIKPLHDIRLLLDPSLVAKTFSYIDGGLTIQEDEGPGKRAVLKSALPRRMGSIVQFFEVVIDPRDGLVLRRCIYDHATGERSIIPFAMTREFLDAVVSDLKKLL